jgi:tubulin delta
VFIQTGQCGNQLGYSLLDKLYSHLSGTDAAAVSPDSKKIQQKSTRKHHLDLDEDDGWLQQQLDDGASALEKYFRYNPLSKKSIARSVSLDTEPKVVQQCLQRSIHPSSQWIIDPRSACYLHGGAGNNWALGYQMASGEFLQTSIDLVTRELEHCDCGQSLVVIHSIAGGTGSGLGTRITIIIIIIITNIIIITITIHHHHNRD